MQKILAFLGGFIARLTSRKFLLTLSAALVLVANQQWTELVILISGYMGIEGAGDLAERVAKQTTAQKQIEQTTARIETLGEDDLIDKNKLTPGLGSSPNLPM